MLQFFSILKLLCEIVGLSLIGQGILYVLAGANREKNFPYLILRTVTSPVTRAVRFITPRFILDQHVGFVALFLVFLIWFWAGQQKLKLCLTEYAGHPACTAMVQKYEERLQGSGQ